VGYRILILGAGIIGNLWASVLHLQGHRRVTVSEPQEARRKLLKNLGEQENESFFVQYHRRFNSLDYIASNDRKNYESETMCKEEDMFYWH
jgi:ketopantoate reductase